MWLKNLPKRKRMMAFLGIGFVAFILISWGTMEYTSRPKFCVTCHYMQPFYDSWVSSTHKDVNCVLCHYEPGFNSIIQTKTIGLVHLVTYITNVYKKSKPTAVVSDASCLRPGCHEERLLSGKEKFNRVFFDHKPHLADLRRGKKLRCTSCHSQIVQGDHMKVTESSCFLCHFKAGPGDPQIHDCKFCHAAPTKENSKEQVTYDHTNVVENSINCDRCHTEMIVGDGAIVREYCYNCHWEQERLERYKETDFMHKMHITDNKIECEQCHTPIQHKLPEKESLHLLDCTACHINAHNAQINLFTGKGGFNAHTIPNPMLNRSITCKGCHVVHEESKVKFANGETLKAGRQSCENCHGKGFARLLDLWEKTSQKKINQIAQAYRAASNEINITSSKNKTKAQELIKEAKYNIDLVDAGKSVHNVQFADELLRGAHKNIVKALELISSSRTISPYPESSKSVPVECNSCHFGIEQAVHEFHGMKFSHQRHVVEREQNCKACHSHERRHGELIATKSKCATCHHNEETKNCSACHTTQSDFYSGKLKNDFIKIEPDVMFKAEVGCKDCHNYEANQTIQANDKSCVDCHDETYKEIYQNWQEEAINNIDSIDNWLKENKNNKLTMQQKHAVQKVENILNIIQIDASKSIHNSESINGVLKKCIESLNAIKPMN